MWISLDDANTNKELLERRAYESSTKMEVQICRDFHAWWLFGKVFVEIEM